MTDKREWTHFFGRKDSCGFSAGSGVDAEEKNNCLAFIFGVGLSHGLHRGLRIDRPKHSMFTAFASSSRVRSSSITNAPGYVDFIK